MDDHVSEVGELAATFNEMLDRIQKLFNTQERLVADVSHELRSPLTTVQGNIELLQRIAANGNAHALHDQQYQETLQETLREVESETNRMSRMINDLLLLAQAGIPLTSGFVAKFTVFSAAVDDRQYALLIIGALTVLILRGSPEARIWLDQAGLHGIAPIIGIIAAALAGLSREAIRLAAAYARERVAFGQPIILHQAIAHQLADMAVEVECSRLLVRQAAWLAAAGRTFDHAEGSMSKLKAGRTAVWVTERAIQILGGYGYTREYPVERMHRDAKIYDIFEGTEQIQQLVISRAISGMHIK